MNFSEFQYERPSVEGVKNEMNQLIQLFKEATSVEEQIALIGKINDIRKELDTAQTLVQIRHTLDTTDSFYEKEYEFFNNFGPEYESLDAQYYAALLETPFRPELEDRFGKQLFHIAESKVKTFSPEVMEFLAEENRLMSEYQKLIAQAKIMFDGEERTLSAIEKFILHPDRQVRKSAAEAKYEFFAQNSEKLDELYDQLVKVRDRIAKTLGFSSFIELAYLRWSRTGWNAESAGSFRENVRKHLVPLVSSMIEDQRQRLGIDKVKIYDEKIQLPEGNPAPKGDPEWIVEQGRKLYSELSPQTKEFYEDMTNRGLFDLVNKPGKANIGYCTYLWKYHAPFVFANCNGTANDIRVLVHEVGHAFQVHTALQQQVQPEYFFPTMEASEIFSMTMELFVFPWSELFFKENAEKHKFAHLSDAIVKMPRLCAQDEFQHEVYANPELTPEERRQLWLEIEKKYMPYRDHDAIPFLEAGGIWQETIHIYEVPFYLIDYALAQVCAIQMWNMANKDWEKAWSTYMHLCSLGGSKSFVELIEEGNLQSPFEENTFIDLTRFVQNELDMMVEKV